MSLNLVIEESELFLCPRVYLFSVCLWRFNTFGGVDKQTLLNDACSNLEKAWLLRSSEKKDEIEKKSQYYRVASDLFKELAYIEWDEQSLKFVEYHNLAFEGAQGYVDLNSYTSEPFWMMINFCELERAKR